MNNGWIHFVVFGASLCASTPAIAKPALDGQKIEQLTGAKGKLDGKEGVFKVSVPRSDLKVIIDLANRKLLGEVKLPAKPQGFAVERGGSRIFANTPQAGQVTVLDRKAQTVVGAWKLGKVRGNYPIALD